MVLINLSRAGGIDEYECYEIVIPLDILRHNTHKFVVSYCGRVVRGRIWGLE